MTTNPAPSSVTRFLQRLGELTSGQLDDIAKRRSDLPGRPLTLALLGPFVFLRPTRATHPSSLHTWSTSGRSLAGNEAVDAPRRPGCADGRRNRQVSHAPP